MGELKKALPSGVASEEEVRHIERYADFLRSMFGLRTLPIDDLALAVGDELFAHDQGSEADLAIAYQMAIVLRYWQEMHPEWRLPDLSAELGALASGREKAASSSSQRLRV